MDIPKTHGPRHTPKKEMLAYVPTYTCPIVLTHKQYAAVKKAFDDVKAKGDPKSFYTPRAVVTPPFLERVAKPVFKNSTAKVFGIARPTLEFEGKFYSVFFKTEGGKKKLSYRFDRQGLSNFVGFGGLTIDITNPNGVVESFWFSTLEHLFQFIKALAVLSDDALVALENVITAKKPVDAKKATGKGKLDVEKSVWPSISKNVMMVLPSFNLKNLPFFDLMAKLLKYAKENGVEPEDVEFVEANDDVNYGSGVREPSKEMALMMDDEYFIKYTNPDLEGGILHGQNILGLALKEAFGYVAKCDGKYSELEFGQILAETVQSAALVKSAVVVVVKDELEEGEDEEDTEAKRQCLAWRSVSGRTPSFVRRELSDN